MASHPALSMIAASSLAAGISDTRCIRIESWLMEARNIRLSCLAAVRRRPFGRRQSVLQSSGTHVRRFVVPLDFTTSMHTHETDRMCECCLNSSTSKLARDALHLHSAGSSIYTEGGDTFDRQSLPSLYPLQRHARGSVGPYSHLVTNKRDRLQQIHPLSRCFWPVASSPGSATS